MKIIALSFFFVADLGDYTMLVCLHQDVVAPEGPTAAAPADPTQPEAVHRILTGQGGHAPLHHFKTGNRQHVSPCSTDTQLEYPRAQSDLKPDHWKPLALASVC